VSVVEAAMTAALAPTRADTFDLAAALSEVDEYALATSSEYRRWITYASPLLFALIYAPHHLRGRETADEITFSDFHLDAVEHAKGWMCEDDGPAEHRDVVVAPRNCGKSTWYFTLLPLWAAAHGHRRFIAAFAHSATQAETHLSTFKRELETNELLRRDFPELCAPAVRLGGSTVSDNRSMLMTKSGFVFAAKGIDSTALGLKVGTQRPDLLVLDDIEPGEETYSPHQKDKRLGALLDSILPLNIFARVVLVGTVTMAGSIVHDAVKTVTLPGETPAQWITDEGFVCHYYPAIVTEDDGTERSIWPAKWSLDYLQGIRHTRSFLKNMMNDPMGAAGDYWAPEDIKVGTASGPLTHQLLSIDPAVTTNGSSDYTGLSIVAFSKPARQCLVRYAKAIRVAPGEPLRALVLRLLEQFPETVGVIVESNQGGDVWRGILHGLPVELRTVHQSEPKDTRAARLLNHYQHGRVLHEGALPELNGQLVGYPKAPYDDLVDAVGTGVTVFLGKKRQVGATTASYI
jgi:hypothetical protein